MILFSHLYSLLVLALLYRLSAGIDQNAPEKMNYIFNDDISLVIQVITVKACKLKLTQFSCDILIIE